MLGLKREIIKEKDAVGDLGEGGRDKRDSGWRYKRRCRQVCLGHVAVSVYHRNSRRCVC